MDKIKLIQELTKDEALKLFPYHDSVGKVTIGIGRNLTDVGISREEASYLLDNDINKVIAQLNDKLPWWITLSENRQRVLVNMCFNMGINDLLAFKNTLAAMKSGDYKAAADGMGKSLWAKQVGERAKRLADMMKDG